MSGVFEPILGKDGLRHSQIVLVLVGLIASGKSTFATALEEHVPHFRRCNQDELGSRQSVERLARQTLGRGLSVCIDRTNFDETQRAHWIKIAHETPGAAIWCLVFDTPFDICATRLHSRTGHPTIKSPQQGLEVLRRFSSDFQVPVSHEGFERIAYIHHPTPVYTKEDIIAILKHIHDSPPAQLPNPSDNSMGIAQTLRAPHRRGPYPSRGVSSPRRYQSREIQSTLKWGRRQDHGVPEHTLNVANMARSGDLDQGRFRAESNSEHIIKRSDHGPNDLASPHVGSPRDEIAGTSTSRSSSPPVSGDGITQDPVILS